MNPSVTEPVEESFADRCARLGISYEQQIENALSIIRTYALDHHLSRDAVLRYFDIGSFASLQLIALKPEDHGNMESRNAARPEEIAA